MRSLRAIAISLILVSAVLSAKAQTAPRRSGEVPFQITGATVQQFDPPRDSRHGRYSEAAVIEVDVAVADYKAEVTPAMIAFLYIGTHEMRPVTFDYVGSRIVMTFHDPRWKELKGGEPMVLTTNHDDPVDNPERYIGYPQWDPGIIPER